VCVCVCVCVCERERESEEKREKREEEDIMHICVVDKKCVGKGPQSVTCPDCTWLRVMPNGGQTIVHAGLLSF